MATNQQRIFAIATTTAIVFGGGWLASILAPTTVNAADSAETKQATSERTRENQQKGSPKKASVLKSAPPVKSIPNASMKIVIDGVRNNRGKIHIALFDKASAFDNYEYTQAIDYRELPARKGSISVDFFNLEEKPYAISLFHDENGNQEFDTTNGYPLEGYGTSRATNAYEELKFHRASIQPGLINIEIFYTD